MSRLNWICGFASVLSVSCANPRLDNSNSGTIETHRASIANTLGPERKEGLLCSPLYPERWRFLNTSRALASCLWKFSLEGQRNRVFQGQFRIDAPQDFAFGIDDPDRGEILDAILSKRFES